MVKRYVLGFLFSPDKESVALICKNRPEWQAGRWNGVGGHVEETDSSLVSAMQREFAEEAGVLLPSTTWVQFATLSGDGFCIAIFKAFSNHVFEVKAMTDETVDVFSVEDVLDPHTITAIPNLRWLIPMALEVGINIPSPVYSIQEKAA